MADEGKCPHGYRSGHWYDEHGCIYFDADNRPGGVVRKYCAGPPRSVYFEAGWRRQIEWQMSDSPLFDRFAGAVEIDPEQVPDDVNEPFRSYVHSRRPHWPVQR